VKLPSTAEYFGAKVTVELKNGQSLTDWQLSGEGLGSDQEHVLIFGLGVTNIASTVSVLTPSGRTLTTVVNKPDQLIVFNND
jgi:hypothetical protein